MSHPDVFPLALLVPLLVTASLPAGSVVLASAWAPVAIAGGLALEYNLVDPRTVPAFGLLAIPGLILGLRTALKYPERLLRRRLMISAALAVMFSSVGSIVYLSKGVMGPATFDFPRHASNALTLLTTGQPPVFYDTLKREYRPVHYPPGLGHTAISETFISYLYGPKDLKDAASWRVQFGSVLLEDLIYHVSAAMMASAIVDLLLVVRRRLPPRVALPLALALYLTFSNPCLRLVPFFQSLAMLAASAVALVLGSRLLSGFLALGSVTVHFYSAVIAALAVPVVAMSRTRIAGPVLVGAAIGAVVQYPYVRWSTMTYFPRYPAHPNHLPPDHVMGPVACALQFPFAALTGHPPNILLDLKSALLLLPLVLVIAAVLVRYRELLPFELRVTWVMIIVATIALGAVSELVGWRLLFVTPILTTASLAVAAVDGCLPALGMLYCYCALTAHWWTVLGWPEMATVEELRTHWKLFHRAFESGEVVATVPEGQLPFTSVWRPKGVARIVRTFPDSHTPLLVITRGDDPVLRFLPPMRVREDGYVVGKLPPLGHVWTAGDRVGSFRGNVAICAERHGKLALIRIVVFDYSWTKSPEVVIPGLIRGDHVSLSYPVSPAPILTKVEARKIDGGFLIREWFPYGTRVFKVVVRGATWRGNELVFRGSLRDLVASVRVAGDLV